MVSNKEILVGHTQTLQVPSPHLNSSSAHTVELSYVEGIFDVSQAANQLLHYLHSVSWVRWLLGPSPASDAGYRECSRVEFVCKRHAEGRKRGRARVYLGRHRIKTTEVLAARESGTFHSNNLTSQPGSRKNEKKYKEEKKKKKRKLKAHLRLV
ncbi:unnamed protein product [Pleuronectes platessa]|uniref:Uncharacterized protein n=1 Tax=Pleuronectes platessa TaxID=8262 RepID=A0A9N7TJX0_PLEPL|nr:unnamed protein product [Pleuronectes platessa]